MKNHTIIYKKYIASIVLLLLMASGIRSISQVTHRDTIVTWRHFDYQLDDNNGMDSYSTTNIIEKEFNGVVIENEYVKLVIIPEFGARIISFFYKPTGHEQLYTNPVGTPYGMGQGNFYYDWLMVYGGIFPTFPEPEHGKTWFLPWQWEFTHVSDNMISLKMQIKDTINFPGHPGKFNNGITEVICISTVTLEKGKTSFDFDHTVQNTKSNNVALEYWTCTTLSPGSVTGNTFTPSNSEIIAPIDFVYLKDDWWSWMGNAEIPATQMGNHVFNYKNLADYSNWDDMGIAYAYPNLEKNYYGVVNHTNNEGIFRVSNNAEITPGMKFWTWGVQQGLNANPENFYDNARPYIELWSGLSTQFFEDVYIGPLETISWTETYLPTVELSKFSEVNENGALYLDAIVEENERFTAELFMNSPDSIFTLKLDLLGDEDIAIFDNSFVAESNNSNIFNFYLSDYTIPEGDYELKALVYNNSENVVLNYTLPVTIPLQVNSISNYNLKMPKIVQLNSNSYVLKFETASPRKIIIYNMNGQAVNEQTFNGYEATVMIETAGIYVIHVFEENYIYPIKLRF